MVIASYLSSGIYSSLHDIHFQSFSSDKILLNFQILIKLSLPPPVFFYVPNNTYWIEYLILWKCQQLWGYGFWLLVVESLSLHGICHPQKCLWWSKDKYEKIRMCTIGVQYTAQPLKCLDKLLKNYFYKNFLDIFLFQSLFLGILFNL